jgi:hypothetical protein
VIKTRPRRNASAVWFSSGCPLRRASCMVKTFALKALGIAVANSGKFSSAWKRGFAFRRAKSITCRFSRSVGPSSAMNLRSQTKRKRASFLDPWHATESSNDSEEVWPIVQYPEFRNLESHPNRMTKRTLAAYSPLCGLLLKPKGSRALASAILSLGRLAYDPSFPSIKFQDA